jgi:O-antigen/teichoic acid export membrane protein
MTSGGLQVAMVASALITLPLLTRALTPAEYGVYATLTGFVSLLAFADLGIGAALTNTLGVAVARGRHNEARVLVATACTGTFAAGLAVFAIVAAILPFVVLRAVVGARQLASTELRVAPIAMAGCVGLGLVGSIGQRALYGVQRGGDANTMLIAATTCAVIAIAVTSQTSAPLYVFVLAGFGVPALASLAMSGYILLRSRNAVLLPNFKGVSREGLVRLARPSTWYFIIAITAAAGYQTDVLVVAAIIGAPAAGVYSICARLFALVTQFIYPALLQLVPAFSAALERADHTWVWTRLRLAILASAAVSTTFGIVMIFAGQDLIRVWLGSDLVPPQSLLVAAAAWTCYSITTAPLYFWLQAMGRVRAHALMGLAVAIANVPLSIVFTQMIGISGPMWGSLVATAGFAGIPALLILVRTRSSAARPSNAAGAGVTLEP